MYGSIRSRKSVNTTWHYCKNSYLIHGITIESLRFSQSRLNYLVSLFRIIRLILLNQGNKLTDALTAGVIIRQD